MALPFDPDAATAAYLATLSPAQHARASAYTHGAEWLLLWGWLVGVLAAWAVLRSGGLQRLRQRLGAGSAGVMACGLAFVLATWLLELPWSIYADWWRERDYGLTAQPFTGWLAENALSQAIDAAVLTGLLLAIYALMRRTPRWWWAWSGGVAVLVVGLVLVVAPVAIEPLFNSYRPAPPGPTRDAIVALASRTGVPADKILVYDGSRQSNRYTANVAGLFGTTRIAMSDTMFRQGADLAEVRGVVGHEMGHYKRGHVLWTTLALGVLAVLFLFGADRLFAPAARLLGARGVGGVSDPAGLPVLVVVLLTLGLLATPLTRTLTRLQETDADRFSLAYAHEPDGLSKALVKTIAYRASSPGPVEEALFYDHPSVERRVHRAMVWQAEHPALVGR